MTKEITGCPLRHRRMHVLFVLYRVSLIYSVIKNQDKAPCLNIV